MGRPKHKNKPEPLTLQLAPVLHRYLTALADGGLYGNHKTDAAVRLIERGIEKALADGTIDRWPPEQPGLSDGI